MKALVLAVSSAFLVLGSAWGGQPLPQRFDPARDAVADVTEAVAQAKAQGKKVLVDVGGEWCAWCRILDGFVASEPEVRRLREENYVLVKVNYSPANKNEQLLSRWPRIKGYPHLFVLDAQGELLQSQASGELEAGRSYDREKMLAFLRGRKG